jgi:hypothetical protein
MRDRFVPDEFIIPSCLETEKFRLRMLVTEDVEKDYEAVMSSREYLRSILDPLDDDTWPEEDMTLEVCLRDLKRHEDDFANRRAFTYTVVSLDEAICLGCIYINPSEVKEYDVEVYFWARQSELANGLEDYLYQVVKTWIKEWPFERVAFPGRDINWIDWRSMLE